MYNNICHRKEFHTTAGGALNLKRFRLEYNFGFFSGVVQNDKTFFPTGRLAYSRKVGANATMELEARSDKPTFILENILPHPYLFNYRSINFIYPNQYYKLGGNISAKFNISRPSKATFINLLIENRINSPIDINEISTPFPGIIFSKSYTSSLKRNTSQNGSFQFTSRIKKILNRIDVKINLSLIHI